MLDRRVTYKRRASYRTRSNRYRIVKTPGGKLAIHYIEKKTKGIGKHGIKRTRPAAFSRLSVNDRTVARPYGGVLTHMEVRERITRAFLIEEINSIKQKAAITEKKSKKSKKSSTAKKSAPAAKK